MRLLLDQGVPITAAPLLRRGGHEVEHVREIGWEQATDEAIIERARETGAVVVTCDSDFHNVLARTHARRPSVLRIREEGLKGEAIATLVALVLQGAAQELADGAVVSATSRQFRCRRLPIAGPDTPKP